MPQLVQYPGTPQESVSDLSDGVHTLGRSDDNDLVIAHRSLSKRHARIDVKGKDITVTDLGSKNGTFVDGVRVRSQRLSGTEKITCGAVPLAIRIEGRPSVAAPVFERNVAAATKLTVASMLDDPSATVATALNLKSVAGADVARTKLELLLQASQLLGSPMPIDDLLTEVLDLAFRIVDVDNAALLLVDTESGELVPRVTRSRGDGGPTTEPFSRSIVEYVRKKSVAAIFSDTLDDPRLEDAATLHHRGIRSSMCVPLSPKGDVLGVLYVDNVTTPSRFVKEDLEFLSAFANQAGVALESAIALHEVRRLKDGLEDEVAARTRELRQALEELKEAQGQLVETEKQAMLGRLVAGIVHEVNTPLGALASATDTLLRLLDRSRAFASAHAKKGDAEANRVVKALAASERLEPLVRDSITRLNAVLGGLRRFVSLDEAAVQDFDVREGLESSLTLLRSDATDTVAVTTQVPSSLPLVRCYPARLNQVFVTVLQNAFEAVGVDGAISLVVQQTPTTIEIVVKDSGPGIPPEALDSIFDFTFAKKGNRIRLTLGLPSAKRALDEMGGTILVDSTVGRGTTVTISLPTQNP